MSDIAIKAENLGKRYFIRHNKKESYETFQDVLINGRKKIIESLNTFGKLTDYVQKGGVFELHLASHW